MFESAGSSGKLVVAVMYGNYEEVAKIIEEATGLGVGVGCL